MVDGRWSDGRWLMIDGKQPIIDGPYCTPQKYTIWKFCIVDQHRLDIIQFMDNVTLREAKIIADELSRYTGPPSMGSIVATLVKATSFPESKVYATIEFVNTLRPTEMTIQQPALPVEMPENFDLLTEIQYSYAIAKSLLQTTLSGQFSIDPEETRENLKVITKFIEHMLKSQEKMVNLQQMQKFQEVVLDVLEAADPQLRAQVVERMLNE